MISPVNVHSHNHTMVSKFSIIRNIKKASGDKILVVYENLKKVLYLLLLCVVNVSKKCVPEKYIILLTIGKLCP